MNSDVTLIIPGWILTIFGSMCWLGILLKGAQVFYSRKITKLNAELKDLENKKAKWTDGALIGWAGENIEAHQAVYIRMTNGDPLIFQHRSKNK